MTIDELAKRRFDAIAGIIARQLTRLEEALRMLNQSALIIETMLHQQLDNIERVTGETAETRALRTEIEATWKMFETPQVLPVIDATKDHFDECAIRIAQIVNALPKAP